MLITQDPYCVRGRLVPIEVLSRILHLSTSDLTTSLRSYKCDGHAEWEPYNRSLHDCAQFRLVDSTWNAVLIPILYSIFVLPAWPPEKQIRRAKAVDYHPEMIRALILSGCTDHHTVEGEYSVSSAPEAEEFFASVQSDSLTSLAILYPTIEVVGSAITGLGTRSSQLKALELYSVYWDSTRFAPTGSLTMHWEWPLGLGCTAPLYPCPGRGKHLTRNA
ncbi:hypothetical protein BDN72DRAFT_854871 [Pluteus cervinus]|uniref:Uncharacterized protein n=1 Tax=Pluteus cervinus TaxID=181527 RepID=A0ACD3B704_9AGAR|nr:hypothetical protein BDN72DRAFT_854871 [Pluteus cervinus]